jgi:hypothetical protein
MQALIVQLISISEISEVIDEWLRVLKTEEISQVLSHIKDFLDVEAPNK